MRNVVLNAPCVFCGYNGPNYFQAGSHDEACPWRDVAGLDERAQLLGPQITTLRSRLADAERERDEAIRDRRCLAEAIVEAAHTAAIVGAGMPLTGPDLLLLLNNLATDHNNFRVRAESAEARAAEAENALAGLALTAQTGLREVEAIYCGDESVGKLSADTAITMIRPVVATLYAVNSAAASLPESAKRVAEVVEKAKLVPAGCHYFNKAAVLDLCEAVAKLSTPSAPKGEDRNGR